MPSLTKMMSLVAAASMMVSGALDTAAPQNDINGLLFLANRQYTVSSAYEPRDLEMSDVPGQVRRMRREAAAALREKQHPAKRCFQAIRIEVNDELGEVERMMQTAPDRLNPGGRLCVISFHSLEDRIVKQAIAAREHGCTCPREAPVCTCGFRQTLKTITRKPILPKPEECAINPRARSAKLRVAERI